MFAIYHSRKHMHAIPEAGRHPAQTRKGHQFTTPSVLRSVKKPPLCATPGVYAVTSNYWCLLITKHLCVVVIGQYRRGCLRKNYF